MENKVFMQLAKSSKIATSIKIAIIMAAILISNVAVDAAQINGRVLGFDANSKPTPLNRARIAVIPSNKGTLTDVNGRFNLTTEANDEFIVVSFVGYQTDTIKISEIEEKNNFTIQLHNIILDAVTVGGDRVATQLSFSDGVRSEIITSRGLQKCACCNLSEAFAVTPSVDLQYSDAVTGAKRIQLLGLQSVYAQIQTENIPIMRGLASNYGFGLVPGQWLESISISKGASTVKNGFESISGLLNVGFKRPEDENPTYLNFYISDMPHLEFNADHTFNISHTLGTMIFVHANGLFKETDHNNDGFIDKPTGQQINIYNRWNYNVDEHKHGIWGNSSGFSFVSDEKKGGQMGYHKGKNSNSNGNSNGNNNGNSNGNSGGNIINDSGNDSLWGMQIKTLRYHLYTKNSFMLNDHGMNIGSILSFIHHNQSSFFGHRNFDGEQNSFYANIMYQNPFEASTITTGVSLQYDNYVQTFQNSPLATGIASANNANIVVPGVFAEYTADIFSDFKVVAGLRADFPDGDYDPFISPRLHLKYNILEDTYTFTVAGSVGRGYRIARVLEENSGYLASNREFVIFDNLQPEEAWNYGINASWSFRLFNIPIDLNADFYRTDFINQVIVDLDKDQNSVYFYNLNHYDSADFKGKSYSNSFQIDATVELLENFYITAAYRMNDVKRTTDGKLQDKALQSKHKSFVNFQYDTKESGWSFDFTVDYNGSGRLPKLITDGIVEEKMFDPYILLNTQITKSFGDLDIYVGGENLTDFMLHHAIKGAATPFAKGFDASMIYGPVTGRHLYLGLRYRI